MPMNPPRLPPLQDHELTAAQEETLAPFRAMGGALNVVRTMTRHPRMLAAFRVWATYVMIDKNKLPVREREIMALRTAWGIRSDYVWSRHLSYARQAALTDAEIEALKRPLDAHPWQPADRALILAADELITSFFISDELKRVCYRASDAVLANSGHEPFGIVGLEVMGAGGIAVVGATGEDYAISFHNCLVTETDDAEEIAGYLMHLRSHPALVEQIRREAQRKGNRLVLTPRRREPQSSRPTPRFRHPARQAQAIRAAHPGNR